MQEDRVHPEKGFCNEFNPYLSTDDQVFKGGLVAYTRNQKDRASLAMPHNDRALWHLINLGARDMPLTDKPWDASTRSVKHGGGKVMAWGCATAYGVDRLYQIDGKMDSKKYISILQEAYLGTLEDLHINQQAIILQADNSPKHTSKPTQA